jgi:hypothetical protein
MSSSTEFGIFSPATCKSIRIVPPGSSRLTFPQESSDTLEEETAEFLELLLRIGFELEEQDAE